MDEASLARFDELIAGMRALVAWLEEDAQRLRCVECGRVDEGHERGWKLRRDVDDDLVAFCPGCDEQEFGDA